jgi:hypothetical protein
VTREDLPHVVEEALRALGGTAPLVKVAEAIWKTHESDLKASGDLFYTWQYDMRWAAQQLRDKHKLTYSDDQGRKVWQLIEAP